MESRPLKIALINRKYTPYGGVERYLSMVMKRLIERGHEVHIFANEWDTKEAGTLGETVHPVPIWRGPSYVEALSFAFHARRRLRTETFDVVHSFDRTISQDIYRAGGGCHREYVSWNRRAASPFLRWLSPFQSLKPRDAVLLWLERKTLTETPITIINSHRVKEEMIRHYGLAPDRLRVIHNGVDLDRFHPDNVGRYREATRRQYGIGEDALLLLFVGSGFDRKGLGLLIQALGRLAAEEWKGLPWRLAVVGRGNPRPYRNLAQRCGVAERFHFLGPVKDIPPLHAAADLFVLPSLYEPFSNACLEALATGVPVVTTRTNGVSEVMQGRDAGGIVEDPLSPAELASKLAPFAEPSRRLASGHEARLAAAEHPVDRKVDQILSLYHEFLRSRS
jgi:UDP-glucose:(heptosyl)LPS alpha-1,3-glucosyltransferase